MRLAAACNKIATLPCDSVGMRPWVANLIGLALGFTIGGEALYIALAPRESATQAPATASPSPNTAPQTRAVVANAAPMPVLQPVELPRIAPAPAIRPDILPQVIYPDAPPVRQEPHKPGSGVAGTGFFVASDGSLLTAAHVVSDCRQIRIASQWIKPAAARTVAVDAEQDIALLRAAEVKPPAMLPVGHPAGPAGRLFVLGYPGSGGPLVATETWAVLENGQFQPALARLTDPRRVIWAAAPAIGHGYSGGPMLDPRNGQVVGIVRGMVDSTRLHAARAAIPSSGMVIGPGSSPLTAMLRQENAEGDALAVSGEDALDAARRATVHVLCMY
jgi:S1-C subfamily serine protease